MQDSGCIARTAVAGRAAAVPSLRVEWIELAHDREQAVQVVDVGGFVTLMTAIVVLCTGLLSALLAAALMLVS
jgi:hypothetical protein